MKSPPLSQLGNYWRSLSAQTPAFTPRTFNRGALSQLNLSDPSAAMFGRTPQPVYWKPSPGASLAPPGPSLPPLSDPNAGMAPGNGGPGNAAPGDTVGTTGAPPGISVDPATGIASPNTASVPGAVSAAVGAMVGPIGVAAMNAALSTANQANISQANSINSTPPAAVSEALDAQDAAQGAAGAASGSVGSSAADAPAGIGGIGGVGDDGGVGVGSGGSSAADAPAGVGDAGDGGGGGGGGGGCFLTEAIMSAGGKDDNAEELQVMRAFRDEYLIPNPQYEPLVKEYYAIAPLVVKALNRRPDAQKIYQFIDKRFIQPAVRMVLEGDIEPAFQHYADMIEFVTPFAKEAEPRGPQRAEMGRLEQGATMMGEGPVQGGALSMMET